MGPASIDWGAPLAVLAVGLGLGALLFWRARRGGAAARTANIASAAVPVEARDLAGQRESLVHQLRELEDTTLEWTSDLSRERYALELKLARVLLALEEQTPAPPRSRKKAPSGTVPAHSGRRAFLWGAGTAASLGLLVFLVVRGMQPRPIGGSVTGSTPMDRVPSPPSASVVPDGEEARVRAALGRDPADLEAHLDLARIHLARRDMREVWAETQYVLGRAPGHPRAMTYQALFHFAAGETDQAVEMLNRVLKQSPDLLEAYRYLIFIHLRRGHDAEADAVVAEATRQFPDLAPDFARLVREMRSPSADAARPASARGVTLVLELDSALERQVSAGSVLFVTVRESGVDGGAPAAVKRLATTTFPLVVSIDERDSMAGAVLPPEMRIEARVDTDGNPLTRSASEPSAQVDGIKAGASAVRLVLTR